LIQYEHQIERRNGRLGGRDDIDPIVPHYAHKGRRHDLAGADRDGVLAFGVDAERVVEQRRVDAVGPGECYDPLLGGSLALSQRRSTAQRGRVHGARQLSARDVGAPRIERQTGHAKERDQAHRDKRQDSPSLIAYHSAPETSLHSSLLFPPCC
jgi:hypothetical protein